MVRGLAALLFQGLAASPSVGPFSAGNACRRCLASRPRHSTSALTPVVHRESLARTARVQRQPCGTATGHNGHARLLALTGAMEASGTQWSFHAMLPHGGTYVLDTNGGVDDHKLRCRTTQCRGNTCPIASCNSYTIAQRRSLSRILIAWWSWPPVACRGPVRHEPTLRPEHCQELNQALR